jgi:hypothetical protein
VAACLGLVFAGGAGGYWLCGLQAEKFPEPSAWDRVNEKVEDFYGGDHSSVGSRTWLYTAMDEPSDLVWRSEGWTYTGTLPVGGDKGVVLEFCDRLVQFDKAMADLGCGMVPDTFQLCGAGETLVSPAARSHVTVAFASGWSSVDLGSRKTLQASMMYASGTEHPLCLSCFFQVDVENGVCRVVISGYSTSSARELVSRLLRGELEISPGGWPDGV